MTDKTKDEQLRELTEIATKLEKAADEVKAKGETFQTEMRNLGAATAETKAAVDKALLEHGELVKKHGETVARITEIERELASRKGEEVSVGKTLGQLFIEDEQVKKFTGSTRGSVRVAMSRKDITSLPGTVGANTSAGTSLQPAMRVPGVVSPPERQLTIRDLLAPGTTSQGMVEYVEETGFTNMAAPVAEAAAKPQSDITFELRTAPVRTIATIFKASRQILDDAPALQSYIDARARYGLRFAEENELLNGDGTGAHLKGLIPSAVAYAPAFTPEALQKMDTIRLAILQVFLAEFPATGIVLHPTDWASIQLLKDSTERYIIGNPQDGVAPRLWNLPVVETQAMAVDEFLVGAFNLAAQIFDRMDVEVLLSTENKDDFEKNMVTIRAEERLALAVYRPEALVTGEFVAGP